MTMRRGRAVQPAAWGVAAALAAAVTLSPAVGSPGGAAASNWVVGVAGTAGSAPFRALFEVDLGDPNGVAGVLVMGVPVVVSHTPSTFSLSASLNGAVGACTEALSATGTAPVQIGNDRAVATGSLAGSGVLDCPRAGTPTPFSISGAFTARTLDITAIQPATVDAASGTAEVVTHRGRFTATPGLVVAPGALIRTGADGTLTLRFSEGSLLVFGRSTVAAYQKASALQTTVHHLKGRLRHVVSRSGPFVPSYRVVTATATIDARGTAFVTDHSEAALVGTTVVSVEEGTVDVSTRRQQLTALAAGLQTSVTDAVPRVSPVLPVDGGSLLQGQSVEFSWTAFAGAAGYLFEFTLGPSGFVTANPVAVESPGSLMVFSAGTFSEADGIVTAVVPVPDGLVPAGAVAQWRVFPVDTAGQILPGATASDASVVILQ